MSTFGNQMSPGIHLRNNKRTQYFVVLVSCLAVLISLLFPFKQNFDDGQLTKSSSQATIKVAHSSDHLPFAPGPFEPSLPNETESTDDTYDEVNKIYEHLSAEVTKELHSEKHIFVQLRTLIENRSTVSYFILYHCWKSFPSELA
jgi:hypothetical protein